jgi:hypothetical protein
MDKLSRFGAGGTLLRLQAENVLIAIKVLVGENGGLFFINGVAVRVRIHDLW